MSATDLFQTGTYHRRPDGYGNTLVQEQKAAGIKWATLNIGVDVGYDPTIWNAQRKLYASAGIPCAPWMHCRSMGDIDTVLSVARVWSSPFVGVNIEDVVKDGLSLEAVGSVLRASGLPVHLPTLPWVQNEQGWQHLDFCVFALEMFPLEGPVYVEKWQECIDHAFQEGAKKVTLLFSTTSPRSAYPNVAHCLYTADNVTNWADWKDIVPQPVPKPPEDSVALTPTQKKKVRNAMTTYCLNAEKYRLNRGYSQRRPGLGYGLVAAAVQIDDCSMFVSKTFYKAMQVTEIPLADPLNYHYSGYGNTESMQTYFTHKAPAGKYLPGDVALWGRNDWDTTHTAVCRKAGTKSTALFTSHGHQSWRFADDAPEAITLENFPEHLIGVYRHPALL